MKKSFLLIGCLALLVAGCSREKDEVVPNENPQEGPERHLVVNITVNQEDPDTRVVKTDWEAGDKVYVAFGKQFGDPNNGKAYYLTLTYDGQKWNSAFSDPGLEALLLRPTGGYLAAAYTSAGFPNGEEPQFACLAPEDQNELARLAVTNRTPGFTMGVGDADYYVEDSGLESVLNATLNMKLIPEYAMVHLFIEGVSEADAGRYSFKNEYIKPVSFDGFQTVKAYNSIQYSVNPLLDHGGYGDPIPADYYKSGIRFCGALDPSMNGRPDRYVIRVTDNRCTPEDVSDDLLYTFEPANEVALAYRKSVKLPPLNSGKWTVTGNSVPEVGFWLEGDPDNYITEVHFAKDFGSAMVIGWASGFSGDVVSTTVTCSEDWLYCSMSGWHMSLFTLSSNDSDEPRVATITITVTSQDGIDTVTKTLTVYQDGANSPIQFESDLVKSIAVANWDTSGDGELSYAEAAAVTSLGGVFKSIPSNTEFTFDELQYFTGLTSIGDHEFESTSMTSVILPPTIKSIGYSAFGYTKITSIVIPEGVTEFSHFVFTDTPLKSLHIPASLTSMMNNPVTGCKDLSSITVSEDNPVYASPNGCNAIIVKATNTLFAGCSSTVIPETVTSIGGNAFHGMKNLKTIELSGTVKEIGSFAFAYSGLQSVGIEYGVETLGSYAFYECDDLETVVIPQSVTSIGDQAFARSGLQSVYDLAMTPQAFSTNMFGGASDSYPIYVPEASVTAYKAKWPNYADRIQGGKVDVNFEGYGDEVKW